MAYIWVHPRTPPKNLPNMDSNFLRPIEIEMIRSSINRAASRRINTPQPKPAPAEANNLLQTKKAGDWMLQEHGKPAAKQLFGSLWTEHELCILFADTNLGKSILAVQIANSLTKICSTAPFYNNLGASASVLYLDFELSSAQFSSRYYSPQWGSYLFSENFYRSEFNPSATAGVTSYPEYNDFMHREIEAAVQKTRAQALIIDNITYMRSGTSHVKDAMALMKMLKALKTKYQLSVLVLAHTPKRNPHKPLTVNDLQGSKMLINFADSAFAIGQSHSQPGMRYLKQIKQRSHKEEYGEGNIALISLENHLNFLRYKFEGFAPERDHIRRPETGNKSHLHKKIIALRQKGHGLRKIAGEVGVHFTTVGKILKKQEV